MRQRAKNKAAFATELQGDPRSDEDKTFTNPRFWVMRSGRWQMFGACDPLSGRAHSLTRRRSSWGLGHRETGT